jgi:hypothetical protein
MAVSAKQHKNLPFTDTEMEKPLQYIIPSEILILQKKVAALWSRNSRYFITPPQGSSPLSQKLISLKHSQPDKSSSGCPYSLKFT